MEYLGDALQDKWVCDFFNHKQNGYYLDIGAMDGITQSNTYVLEKNYDWNGICVECQDIHLVRLEKNRNCEIIRKGIWKHNGNASFNTQMSHIVNGFHPGTPIQTVTFEWIFSNYDVPTVIDYISMDIEGAEYDALTKFPFDTHVAILWTIEHNLYIKNDPTLKNNIKKIMLANNYVLAAENVSPVNPTKRPDIPFEDWYIHKDYK